MDTDAEPPPFTAASADYALYTLNFLLCEQYPERPRIADSQYAYCAIHQGSARGQRGSVESTGVTPGLLQIHNPGRSQKDGFGEDGYARDLESFD